jgi:hypothetical protein
MFRLSTGNFRKYPSQTWYICIELKKERLEDVKWEFRSRISKSDRQYIYIKFCKSLHRKLNNDIMIILFLSGTCDLSPLPCLSPFGTCDLSPLPCFTPFGTCDLSPLPCLTPFGTCDLSPLPCLTPCGTCDLSPLPCSIPFGTCDLSPLPCLTPCGTCDHSPLPCLTTFDYLASIDF